MSNLHRLQWIDAQIRAGRYPNTRELAAAFEISRRQALRDFEYLRDSLGAPVVYAAAHRGYSYASDTFTLPGAYVTGSQKSLLTNLATYYSQVAYGDSRFCAMYAEMAGLFRRLGGGDDAGAAKPPVAVMRKPFRALLRLEGEPPEALRPYWRGGAAYEFDQPEPFLRALLGAGVVCRVEWPAWFREDLQAHLAKMWRAQGDVTSHVAPPLVSSNPERATSRRYQEMSDTRKVLDARMSGAWQSYVGAAYGVLKAANMFEGSMTELAGMSGMAFHLIMEQGTCISSATVYNWMEEHQTALDRVGVLSELYGVMPGHITYEAAVRRAVTNIKTAIDQGVGVILWGVDTGEFGVIHGYDDADGVFFTSGCFKPELGPVLYENVGRTFEGAPILHYQIPIEKVAFDPAVSYRQSLEYYVAHTESPFHSSPTYKSGLLAYDNWVKALRRGQYSDHGLNYNTIVIAENKRHAASYLRLLAERWDARLAPAAALFERNAGVLQQMLQVMGQQECGNTNLFAKLSQEQVRGLIPLVEEARAIEVECLAAVKAFLASK